MTKPNASSAETRRRLIEAATRLFAEHGFRQVSTRDIARDAGVNSALINYHFGGKDGIFEEVIRASAAEHVAERMHQLTLARARGEALDLEGLLKIYLQPLVKKERWDQQRASFARLHAAMMNERAEVAEDIASRAFNTVNVAFIDEMAARLPHLDREVVVWRFYAMIGSLLFFGSRDGPPGMLSVSGGRCDTSDPDAVLRQLLPYLVAGLSAPMPAEAASSDAAPAVARR